MERAFRDGIKELRRFVTFRDAIGSLYQKVSLVLRSVFCNRQVWSAIYGHPSY